MCGICGIVALDGRPADGAVLSSMTDALGHRGPDDKGIYVDGPAGLGHTRLSILDLSAAGHQPMLDPANEIVLTFNGEIYNYPDLRRQIEGDGVRLRSHTDTEVLLHLYKKYGTECPRYLRGMFAFAIWDRRTRSLFIARDRVGIKPFYYYLDNRSFVFGSEIKAICRAPGLDLALDLNAVSTFFAYGHSFAPQTIYARVQKLQPGCSAVVTRDGCRVTRYWDIDPAERRNGNFETQEEHLADLLSDSVQAHLLADVPVGVFLSGGIDSSLIAALAAQGGERVRTFAVGFDIGGYYNELDAARLVAKHISAEHHELVVNAFDVPALLERLVWHYDEPFADAAAMPTYLLSKFARESVKVALSGEGGDELFGGYRRYVTQLLSRHYRWLAPLLPPGSLLRRVISTRDGWRRVKKVLESVDVRDDDRRYAHWLTSFTPAMRQEVFAGALRAHDAAYDATRHYTDGMRDSEDDPLNRLLLMDFRTWLPDTYLEKVDKASMAVGLEARVPFLDHPVVEHAFALPGGYKISRFRKKYILRAVAAGVIPQQILTRPKHGFAVPIDEWFRGELLGYVKDILLDPRVARRGYCDVQAIERLIAAHVSGQNEYGTQIWQLLNFELWHRQYVDSPPASAFAAADPSHAVVAG